MSSKRVLRQADRDAIFREAEGKHEKSTWETLSGPPELPGEFQVTDSSDWFKLHPNSEPTEPTHHAAPTKRLVILPHWDPEMSAEILHDHHAEMNSKTAALSYDPNELMNAARSGGFTLHDHIGDAPTSGYMVSQRKDTEKMLPMEQLTPQHVSDYVGAHTRELAKPNAYLGGWLDGKNFYLDVSSHRPTIDRAAADAVHANQLAIYDLNKGQAINTPDAVAQSGDIGLATTPKPKNPFLGAHDWTTHGLGDPEQWSRRALRRAELMASVHVAETEPSTFDMSGLTDTGDVLGSHGAQVWKEPKTGKSWLIKPTPPSGKFLADLDVGANQIATHSGVDTPATFKTSLHGTPASAQEMYPNATNAFPNGKVDADKLSDDDLLTIQKHHALDWALGNHDSHIGQFIRSQDGKLIGIDKGQAFKYINQDRLHWNFHPNGYYYNENEPVYNTLYRNMAKGGKVLNDPRDGELGKYIQGIQDMPDEEYTAALMPYAKGAAAQGLLGKVMSGYPMLGKPRFQENDVDGFIKTALDRKHNLMNEMGDLHDRAMAHRMTGTKIAKIGAPDPLSMRAAGKQLGSHGAEVYQDPSGQWLIKRPPRGEDFMAPLDQATSQLQDRVELPAPETHMLPWHGVDVTAVKMIPGARQAWAEPPELEDVDPKDLVALQKHQALDWLISNHDGHVGNFLRTPQGDLVGIDKGQAFKYAGRDRLDPHFHPNFYAREPIYNNLWRGYAQGSPGEMLDPRDENNEVGAFVKRLQDIPDADLKNTFHHYALAAADSNQLANLHDDDERRKLDPPRIPPNDPDAFLEHLAQRKNSLATDLGQLFDRASASRKKVHAGMGW